jgi:tRNA pseudouridine38-40 synthase
MRYFIELAYNGAAYHGWQRQDSATSVQEVLETGLRYKMGQEGGITGCGRTDAGVHARQFFAHFDFPDELQAQDLNDLCKALNRYLPNDIAIYRIFRVSSSAHARFDAHARTYKYYINQEKNPFTTNLGWNHHFDFDLKNMNAAAASLKTYTDFTSFAKLHTDVKTNNCKVSEAWWEQKDGQLIFTITADRFLRNMVRAVVGTLTQVGRGKITIDDLHAIIQSKNRSNAGMSVPAAGLFLHTVVYDWDRILSRDL